MLPQIFDQRRKRLPQPRTCQNVDPSFSRRQRRRQECRRPRKHRRQRPADVDPVAQLGVRQSGEEGRQRQRWTRHPQQAQGPERSMRTPDG